MGTDDGTKKRTSKAALKMALILFCCVGVVATIRIQRGLAIGKTPQVAKPPSKEGTKSAGTTTQPLKKNTQVERLKEEFGTKRVENAFKPADPPLMAGEKPKRPAEPVLDSDATEDNPDPPQPQNKAGLPFSTQKPVLVLSLPNHAELGIARYFKCAGVVPNQLAHYWADKLPRIPVGKCMYNNLRNNATLTTGFTCGQYAVYTELQYIEAAKTKGSRKHPHQCFDPVLFPGALEKLYEALPNAYIMMVEQDAEQWYDSLPKDIKGHWKKWCNPTHSSVFPTSSGSKEKYVQFYHDYHNLLKRFIEQHEGWTAVEVNLEHSLDNTAQALEDELKIPAQCWTQSMDAPLRIGNAHDQFEPHSQPRPNVINYPIISVGLPKSGSALAHEYFQCGLGQWAAKHQWTTPSKSTIEEPLQDLPIGQCFEKNHLAATSNNLLKGCGHARAWSDIGYLRDKSNNGTCFYPTLQPGVLDQLASYYPHATLVHVVRTPEDWYNSAHKYNDLPRRWSAAQNCHGFPSSQATPEEWMEFYKEYTTRMRTFASQHTNLTYIEVPLSKEGGQMLQEVYQFPDHCWPNIPHDA